MSADTEERAAPRGRDGLLINSDSSHSRLPKVQICVTVPYSRRPRRPSRADKCAVRYSEEDGAGGDPLPYFCRFYRSESSCSAVLNSGVFFCNKNRGSFYNFPGVCF